jgi:hypothetical protein
MPCHHNLEEYLGAYIEGAGIATDAKGYLFRTARGRGSQLSDKPMAQQDVYRMIRQRAVDAAVRTKTCCHSFRATGITEYLRNGGKQETARQSVAPKLRCTLVKIGTQLLIELEHPFHRPNGPSKAKNRPFIQSFGS